MGPTVAANYCQGSQEMARPVAKRSEAQWYCIDNSYITILIKELCL